MPAFCIFRRFRMLYSRSDGFQAALRPCGCGEPPRPLRIRGSAWDASDLPSSPMEGDVWKAMSDGLVPGAERGDLIVCVSAQPVRWQVLSGHDEPYVLPKATATELGGVYVDVALDASSDNPVENRAISAELDEKADAADIMTISNAEILGIITGRR